MRLVGRCVNLWLDYEFRRQEAQAKLQSEHATMEYLKQHTQIPTPEVYHLNYVHGLGPDNPVGPQYMLLEHLPGKTLWHIWEDATLDGKMHIITQIAEVISELAAQKFEKIGFLQLVERGFEIQPVKWKDGPIEGNKGPFTSSTICSRSYPMGSRRNCDLRFYLLWKNT